MQREYVLSHALTLLEQHGLSSTLETLLTPLKVDINQIKHFWPDREALLYDCLRHHGQQIEIWQRQILLDEVLSPEQKLLARYDTLKEKVQKQRYPGCLFIAACSVFPDTEHPIHQLAELQKQNSFHYTVELLQQLEIENSERVAKQMELILEGCLSKLLVKRELEDVITAKLLAQDILTIAKCRKNGAFS
ncbi:putative regulator with homeodomain-like DNA binding domain with homeodomain-like DNA binding domain (TetR/AcrR family) [Xenorhabdus bovienii str. Jollieti]|uniref:Putative regulator with homeodomain-like DNA binding domain with homeodomain-like DNA binding domain (TetR/AcrR family) n=1 Tax=Xenorhabdus bovienii (strain SS-2004) TaxID=406818 RepID=D3V038_XENBS|nr:transcriptional regulator [Xenorhabdus bovienii]CBJ80590.1 putative regulator with homeodomain-like DNA binding domain with homeodomain-like DNA binding domain (TetR/AcrR family) [Xenorhabdus bovienii SS-2004]CDH29428.1 putative regulator with homeodomain-like DNA binding domain with homeodomain-like DNA binding domain (TetR/AcrR family) [Xenorhabdus bovienii str. Jollieti]